MAINDRLRVTTEGTLYGVQCINVFNYVETGASASFSSERAIVDTFVSEIVPAWMLAVADDFTLHCVSGEKLGAGPSAPYTRSLATGNVGLAGTPSLPSNRVATITLYSPPGVSSSIGKKSFSGIPSAEETDNAITTAYFALLENLGIILIGGISGVGGFSADHVIRSAALALDFVVINTITSAQVRTLRGRTPRLC